MDQDTLTRIEGQRVALENDIAKLRKTFRHWQTLETDYEGLKEEFLGLDESSTPAECLQAAKDFKPELLDDKELETIVKEKRPLQLVELLTKRIDYVTRNVETIRQQLSTAQKQWNAVVLAEDPEHRNEAALPLKEVIEELDDQGNVISTTVKAAGGESSELVDVLRQAGVPDLPDTELHPKNPNDTQEEAQLRQEMLEYGLNEVGQIVAELELEGSDEFSDDDDDDNDDFYDEEESEDERGAAKHLVISDRYRQQMEALEAKLGIKNHGPDPRPPAAEAARKAAIARAEAAKAGEKDTGNDSHKRSRKVAFAEELDIADEQTDADQQNNKTVKETVVERSRPIVQETLVERPAVKIAPAPDSLDFDEDMHRRDIATEYQKLRNRKIHAQGGYVGAGEQDNYGDDTVQEVEVNGKPKRISRFKAARIKS